MIKNIKVISTFLSLFLLLSCGYKIANQEKTFINLQNVNLSNDSRISQILRNNILLISSKDAGNRYEIILGTKENKTEKIKNSAGIVSRYSFAITVNLVLKNIDNQKEISKSFTQAFDYDVEKVHSDTVRNQKNVIKILTQKLSEDIIKFINFSTKDK